MSRAIPLDYPFDKAAFAELLRKAQGERQQKQFADDIGMSKSYLNCYLGQKMDRPLTPTTLRKIVRASGGSVTYEELLIASGYDPKNHIIERVFHMGNGKTATHTEYAYQLEGVDEELDFIDANLKAVTGTITNALASKGYKWSGKAIDKEKSRLDLCVSLYDESISEWGFIYLEPKDDDYLYNFPSAIVRIREYATALLFSMKTANEKISFVTTREHLYEEFRKSSVPALALYVSIILIDEEEMSILKEESIPSYIEASEDIPTLL